MPSPNPSHPMDDLSADNARLRREVHRLRTALRRCFDDARAAVGDTDTVTDRACGMCRLARDVRDTAKEALGGTPAPRVKR